MGTIVNHDALGFRAIADGVGAAALVESRTYLASTSTVGSERGHAMIVRYTGETVTRKHHHPNAESMFVMLEGRVRFLVDGKEETPGAFTTRYDE
jgi:quercetin dioxygenase-like cupin family protein